MRVRDFHAQDSDAHPLARDGLADGDGDFAGELRQALIGLFVQVENVVVLHMLGNHEGVALGHRGDVQESVEVFALRALVGRDLAVGDPGKDGSHITGKCPGS